MKSLINKNKQISKQRKEFVEHNFEAMIGARKRRYNDIPQQKQRTEFLEDYYLLYTRNKSQLNHKKAMWNELKEWVEEIKLWNEKQMKEARLNLDYYIRAKSQNVFINKMLDKIQELEKGEKDGTDR